MVIRMRHTRAHTGNRRSHHALKTAKNTITAEGQRHCVDPETGMYRGRQVIDVTKKALKKAKKAA
jgi:ribosomal protein L32